MNFDIPPEAAKAAAKAMPGVGGALVALIWFRGSMLQRTAAFIGGSMASYHGAEELVRRLSVNEGFAGFILGLFGMAIAGKVFETLEQVKLAPSVQKFLRRIGL